MAVAVGSAFGALGTDTGGSIRVPAALNGVIGLKPTFGSVDTTGVVPMSTSLDTVGCLARTVDDCAALFTVLSGGRVRPEPRRAVPRRIGHIQIDDSAGIDGGIAATLESVLRDMNSPTTRIVDVERPLPGLFAAVGNVIAAADGAAHVDDYLYDRASHFSPGTLTTLVAGKAIPGDARRLADGLRSVAANAVRALFDDTHLDVLALPSFPVSPGAPRDIMDGGGPNAMRLAQDLLMLANVTGLPALTVPCGTSGDGTPIGLQLVGRQHDEDLLFEVARTVADRADWHERLPRRPESEIVMSNEIRKGQP